MTASGTSHLVANFASPINRNEGLYELKLFGPHGNILAIKG
jgi:hypothetical protein